MSNSAWAETYPSGRSEYLKFEGSDHRPLVTFFDLKKKKSKSLFRYDRRLRNNPEVTDLIVQAWQAQVLESVEKKLSRCRVAIIKWNMEQQLNSQKTIDALKEKLEEVMVDPNSLSPAVTSMNEALKEAYKKEEEFWKQRSRQLWLTLGDKNTGYFHAITKGKRA